MLWGLRMSGKFNETAAMDSVASCKRVLRGGVAVGALVLMSSAAQAQCVGTGVAGAVSGLLGVAAGAAVNTVVSATTTANTAFLTQSTAFVGAPANPQPGQKGGGVWGRAIGGQIDTKNTSTTTNVTFAGGALPGNVVCNTQTQLDFAGFQVGADLGKFNINGWNFHYGATAGYLAAKAKDKTPGPVAPSFTNNLEVPFVGGYAALTRGGLFIDGQMRFDYYQNELNDPNVFRGTGVFNQLLGAKSFSIAGNIGYNHALSNQWFIEPSAGFVWSRTKVDPFSFSGTFILANSGGFADPGTLTIDNIDSILGRASIRVGTVVQAGNWVLSPFVTGSIYHEFGDPITANYASQFSALVGAPVGEFTARVSTSTLGTWGQVALGVAGQLPGSGWVWYTRGDYRFGADIEGWSLNGGIRYHYVPEPLIASKMPTKGPIIPVSTAVDWTGVYIGGSVGGIFAEQDVTYPGLNVQDDPRASGVLAGGQIGYNHQVGKWIFGIEAEASWSNARNGRACNPPGFNQVFFTCVGEIDWTAAGTVKIGYAVWDRAYVYVKGGVMAADVTFQSRCNNGNQPTLPFFATPLGCPVQSDSATAVGWTAGWGSEFALTQNWSARSETRYFDLGSVDLNHPGYAPLAFATPKVQTDGWMSTIGVNYRFPVRRM